MSSGRHGRQGSCQDSEHNSGGGASWRSSDASQLSLLPLLAPIQVQLPNGSVISSSAVGHLHIPYCPFDILAYVFDDKTLNTSLLSVSQLCNLGCEAIFTDTNCTINYKQTLVLHANKPPTANLWHWNLPHSPSANASLLLSSDRNFVLFAHASLGSPSLRTFLRAVKLNYLPHWPRLSPTPAALNHVYVRMQKLPHQLSSDLTGRFPIPSTTGSQYVLVTEYEGYIHAEAMASRNHIEYVRAFKNVVKFFTALGKTPFYQRLDNESSAVLESYFKSQNITIQYCPPGQHRANSAERCIQTYKNHVISTLATTDPAFPLPLWDRLLPQIELCLNHLRPFKPNPTISAYAGIHGGSHDFRAQPIAPAGIKVLIHDKPSARASWASHGVEGFYLGPALQHYRCYHVYVPSTSTTRVTDTVQWFPHGFLMPDPSPHDIVTAAIADLSHALRALTSLPRSTHNDCQPILPSTITDNLHDLLRMYSPPLASALPPLPSPSLPSALPLIHSAAPEQRVLPSPTPLHDHHLPPHPPNPSPARSPTVASLANTTAPEQRVPPTLPPLPHPLPHLTLLPTAHPSPTLKQKPAPTLTTGSKLK